jgi:pre-mRNA-splicing factor 38A
MNLSKMKTTSKQKIFFLCLINHLISRYVRLLGAFYLRLVGKPVEIYEQIEFLYSDYRSVRRRSDQAGVKYDILHVDECADDLIQDEMFCGIVLPHLPKRKTLEEIKQLTPRKSLLDFELGLEEEEPLSSGGSDSEGEKTKIPAKPLFKQPPPEIISPTPPPIPPPTNMQNPKQNPSNYSNTFSKQNYNSSSVSFSSFSTKSTDFNKPPPNNANTNTNKSNTRSQSRSRSRSRSRSPHKHRDSHRSSRRSRSRSRSRDRRDSRRDDRSHRRQDGQNSSNNRLKFKRDREEEKTEQSDEKRARGGEEELGLEETNALRIKLGLKPLKK